MGNNPCIEVESSYGTREVALSTRHLMNRNIFILGEINSDMANRVLSELMYLSEENAPINIFINTLKFDIPENEKLFISFAK